MDLAGTIRRLRREKDVTQEKLASVLGVTFQTVSKWERGEALPDITLLPVIAAYFGTTADVLLGTDAERVKLRNFEADVRMHELRKTGDRNAVIAFLREFTEQNADALGFAKVLAYELMDYAGTLSDVAEKDAVYRESLSIYERLLEFEPSDARQQEMAFWIASLLWKMGESKRAEEYITKYNITNSFDPQPERMKNAREKLRIQYAAMAINDAFKKICEAVDCMVDMDDKYDCGFTDAEKLKRLEQTYQIAQIIFDDGKYQAESDIAAHICADIAELRAKSGDADGALAYLERAVEHASEYDGLTRVDLNKDAKERGWVFGFSALMSHYTSTLLTDLHMGSAQERTYKEPTASGELLRSRLPRPAFDALREDARFTEIETRLRGIVERPAQS